MSVRDLMRKEEARGKCTPLLWSDCDRCQYSTRPHAQPMQPLTQAGWPLSLLCQVHVHSVLYNTCSVSGSLGLFAGAYCFLFRRRLCTLVPLPSLVPLGMCQYQCAIMNLSKKHVSSFTRFRHACTYIGRICTCDV